MLAAALAGQLHAQGRTITGTVSDSASGQPLAGAQITVRGTVVSGQTRENGTFVLNRVPERDVTLSVRLIGYRGAEVAVSGGETGTVTIALAKDPFKLDEVVVTGQATGVERRNLANAISTVSSEDLADIPSASIEHQLQGKVAGADIQTNSGAPGGGVQVRLRGITSINASAEPLYVVDGVIMSDIAIPSNQNAVTSASGGSNPELTQDAQVNRIVDLNPADIERVEVLKGASASAIYGGRASNGVVIITTKKGRPGKTQVNLTQRAGFFALSNKYGSRRFANDAEVDAAYGAGTGATYGCTANSCPFFDHEQELAGRKPLSYETVASLSGGDDNTRYFASGTVKRDGGIIENTGFQRHSVRMNLDQRLGSRLNLSLNTNVAHTKAQRGLTNNDNTGTSYYVVLASTPSFVDLSRNPDGSFKLNPFVPSNPLQTAALSRNDEDVWRLTSGANLEWRAIQSANSSLRLIANGGLDFFNQKNALFFPPELQFEPTDGKLGTSLLSKSDNTNLNLFGTAVHNYSPASRAFSATTSAGVQYSRRNLDIDRTTGRNLVGGQSNVDAATEIAVTQRRELAKNLGYFLQEEVLTMGERLLLSAAMRADQSSLNADSKKLFWYPKAAASFRFPNMFGEGGDLKFRTAYGESGNEPSYGQIFTPLNSTGNINGLPALVIETDAETGAPDLRPERMREIEAGVDAALARGRANIEFTVYRKNVSDLLLRRDLPESSGFSREIFNGGKLRTEGIETALGLQLFERRSFSWLFRTTFTMSRSKITQLDVPAFQQGGFGASLGTWKFEEDSSATRIVGNTIAPDGSVVVARVGDSNPDFRMGFGSDMTAGRFGFHFLFDWQKGSNISNLTTLLYDLGQVTPDYGEAISGSDETVGQKRFSDWLAGNTSSYIESASFLKLREVTLSYDIPQSAVRGLLGGRSARLSLSARNLFTVTNYRGLDPEVSNFGNQAIFRNVDVAPFPPSRSFWFSIDLGL
ncbi:MAG TPA: SusC/RagA family TonB-linked outer membrane protein [Gemmatimonadales bacterium]|nr:SusC/RagA family TonB-linked outer membrane protein [Gemmatimonadales bacterium]